MKKLINIGLTVIGALSISTALATTQTYTAAGNLGVKTSADTSSSSSSEHNKVGAYAGETVGAIAGLGLISAPVIAMLKAKPNADDAADTLDPLDSISPTSGRDAAEALNDFHRDLNDQEAMDRILGKSKSTKKDSSNNDDDNTSDADNATDAGSDESQQLADELTQDNAETATPTSSSADAAADVASEASKSAAEIAEQAAEEVAEEAGTDAAAL